MGLEWIFVDVFAKRVSLYDNVGVSGTATVGSVRPRIKKVSIGRFLY